MEWFRCYSEFATDSKVQIMPEHMQRRLIMLFCLRSCNALATLHAAEIAFALRITEQELIETKTLFIQKEFIDDEWNIQNWDKRQYISDTSTERSRKYRNKKKKSMQQGCNVAATPPDQNQIRTESDQNITDQEDSLNLKNDFNIDLFLTDVDRMCIKAEAPGWDLHALIITFNAYVKRKEIPKHPSAAFLAWTISFTKGKSP